MYFYFSELRFPNICTYVCMFSNNKWRSDLYILYELTINNIAYICFRE